MKQLYVLISGWFVAAITVGAFLATSIVPATATDTTVTGETATSDALASHSGNTMQPSVTAVVPTQPPASPSPSAGSITSPAKADSTSPSGSANRPGESSPSLDIQPPVYSVEKKALIPTDTHSVSGTDKLRDRGSNLSDDKSKDSSLTTLQPENDAPAEGNTASEGTDSTTSGSSTANKDVDVNVTPDQDNVASRPNDTTDKNNADASGNTSEKDTNNTSLMEPSSAGADDSTDSATDLTGAGNVKPTPDTRDDAKDDTDSESADSSDITNPTDPMTPSTETPGHEATNDTTDSNDAVTNDDTVDTGNDPSEGHHWVGPGEPDYDPDAPSDYPIVGPPPEAVVPPTPTYDEWVRGLKYMNKDCLERLGVDDNAVVGMLSGDEYYRDVFPTAFVCFDYNKYDTNEYPSYHRDPKPADGDHDGKPAKPTPSDPAPGTDGTGGNRPVTPQPDDGNTPPGTPGGTTGGITPGGSSDGHNDNSTNPTPGTSEGTSTGTTPGATTGDTTTPTTDPSTNGNDSTTSQPTTEGTDSSSTASADTSQRHPGDRWRPKQPVVIYTRDGVTYVRPWTPPVRHGRQPLALGSAINVLGSSVFADPYTAQNQAQRLAPAGPDALDVDDFLKVMGLTALDIPWAGNGTALAVEGNTQGTGSGKKVTYDLQIEGALPVDKDVFASKFQEILDKDTRYSYQRRSQGKTDITFVIGSPSMTQQLCSPGKPQAKESGSGDDKEQKEPDNCVTKKHQVVINMRLWMFGEAGEPPQDEDEKMSGSYVSALEDYREKLVIGSVDKVFDK